MDKLTQAIIAKITEKGYTKVGENRFIGKGMPLMWANVRHNRDFTLVTMMHQDMFCDSFMVKG